MLDAKRPGVAIKQPKGPKRIVRRASSPRQPSSTDLTVLKFNIDGTLKPHVPTNLPLLIREKSRHGRSLVNVLLEIALNSKGDVRYSDQIAAICVLFDRGWGKPVQTITEIDATSSNLDLAALSSDELATLGTILARAQKPAS